MVRNERRFNTKTKNFSSLIRELLYADDADFVSHSEEDLQEIMNLFSTGCDAFGLTISIKKTKVTGMAVLVRKSILHLNNQGVKKGNSHGFFDTINWTRTGSV